ncbi:MAG: hypothetical protein QOE61_6043 [Micromonosporaceae bacterium]|nr:hypothetical protein [Micromonosporaceae bacterium]
MNKCRHCGASVPVEKAFCPNCSEPIEPEEAPNRAKSFSSDMLATLRDDPENYRQLLLSLKKKPAAESAEAPSPDPEPARSTPSVTGFSSSQMAPPPPAPAKSNKRNLVFIIGAVSILILLFVLLRAFKII